MRHGALLALRCVAHNKPTGVRDALPELLPLLYEQTKKRPELVHQVELGPSNSNNPDPDTDPSH